MSPVQLVEGAHADHERPAELLAVPVQCPLRRPLVLHGVKLHMARGDTDDALTLGLRVSGI